MKIYTDGSANPNPGPGGFGVIVLDNSKKFVYHIYRRSVEKTTNNREELSAILYCMKKYGLNKEDIPIVYSDSSYAINTYTKWMFNWERNNWYKSDNNKAENLDIIQQYFSLYQQGYRIILKKVKGHSGDKWNEFADKLASNQLPLEKLIK